MRGMGTRSFDNNDKSEKFVPKGRIERWLFALATIDLVFFVLFGFLLLIPTIVRVNLLILLSLILASIYYIIKNRNLELTSVLALLFSLAIFYVNFMMLYGNWVSNIFNG